MADMSTKVITTVSTTNDLDYVFVEHNGDIYKITRSTLTDLIGQYSPSTASDISVLDEGGYFVGENIEAVLQEIGDAIQDINSEIASIRETLGEMLSK